MRSIIIHLVKREIDEKGVFEVSRRAREEKRRCERRDNEPETIDRVKQISHGSMSTSVHATRGNNAAARIGRAVILRSTATDETMVPLFIS